MAGPWLVPKRASPGRVGLLGSSTKTRKMAFFEGCPVGWAGVPTGAGLVDVPKKVGLGWLFRGQGRVGLAGQGLRGGPRASVPGGVGGRGTGLRDGANFATF